MSFVAFVAVNMSQIPFASRAVTSLRFRERVQCGAATQEGVKFYDVEHRPSRLVASHEILDYSIAGYRGTSLTKNAKEILYGRNTHVHPSEVLLFTSSFKCFYLLPSGNVQSNAVSHALKCLGEVLSSASRL